MLLRRSGETNNQELVLEAITGAADKTIGVPDEEVLVAIADAVYSGEPDRLSEVRALGVNAIGPTAVVDAIGVAAAFNGITKIANATGIPLDESTDALTPEMRASTGIDRYSDASKSRQFD